jgi:hypothetical protein
MSVIRAPLPGQRLFDELERDLEEMRRSNPVPPREEWPWIPTLDLGMQAEQLEVPVKAWGSQGRELPNEGSYHFYVCDNQFNALWKKPDQLVRSGCKVATEVNYSTWDDSPKMGVLWTIYRKRILAAYWQMCGVRILVDLNLNPEHSELALVGVPRGWRAYANRFHSQMHHSQLEREHAMAAEHAGTSDILYVVFGGGKRARRICDARGWIHVPDHSECVRGRMLPYGATE